MTWVAVAVGGASLIGGAMSSNAAGKAADAQAAASGDANALQKYMYDQTRQDQMPWLKTGRNALAQLNRAANGNMRDFRVSPDYRFVQSEGMRGIGNSFAAKGGAFGGNALQALSQYNTNLASGEFGNWWNRRAGLAGVGQQSASDVGQAGSRAAYSMGQNAMAAGDARASGIMGQSNAWGNAAQGLAGAYGYYQQNKKPLTSSGT